MSSFDLLTFQSSRVKRQVSSATDLQVQSIEIGSTSPISITKPGAAQLSLGTASRISNLLDPTAAQDAATKFYVDSVASGLDLKASVRLATAAALPANTAGGSGVGKTLTADANGALTVDGVAVAVSDRILVKNETPASDNGIYVVTATGDGSNPYVLTRATDADQDAEVTPGLFTFVEEGTVNADTGWVLITNATITVDTTSLSFTQFSGAGSITAGAGLTGTSTFAVELDTDAAATGAGSGGGSSGLEFDAAGDAGQLRVAVHASGAIERSATGLQVQTDGTTIEVSSNDLRIAAGAAGAGLTGGGGSALAVGAGDGITVNANDVALASTTAGAGLTYTSGVLDVGAGNGITVNANDVALASTTAGAGLTYTTGVLDVGAGDGISVTANAVAVNYTQTLNNRTGGAVAAGDVVALSHDATDDAVAATVLPTKSTANLDQYILAVVLTGGANGASITVFARRGAVITDAAFSFTDADIGKNAYVTGTGGDMATAPTFVANDFVYSVGRVYGNTSIIYDPQFIMQY